MATNGDRAGAPRRTKEGARSHLPGSYVSIFVSLQRRQLAQLDQLALEIRAMRGTWITRSGIITAIIEARLRTTPLPALPEEAYAEERRRPGGWPGGVPPPPGPPRVKPRRSVSNRQAPAENGPDPYSKV